MVKDMEQHAKFYVFRKVKRLIRADKKVHNSVLKPVAGELPNANEKFSIFNLSNDSKMTVFGHLWIIANKTEGSLYPDC